MSERSLVVLVPYATHIEPDCDAGLRLLEKRGYEVRRYPSTAAVDRTRSEAVTKALADGFDEIMWIDSDITFEADAVERLRSHDRLIVGGAYAKKGLPAFALKHLDTTTEFKVGEGAGVIEVEYLGFGFVLVRRKVFEDVAHEFSLPLCNTDFVPCVPYFLPMVMPRDDGFRYLSEDFAFCERARQCGHHVFVDGSIRLGHLGKYVYRWENFTSG